MFSVCALGKPKEESLILNLTKDYEGVTSQRSMKKRKQKIAITVI